MGCQESKIGQNPFQNQNSTKEMYKKMQKNKKKNQRLNKPVLESLQIYENIKKIEINKTNEDIQFIERVITKHFLLFKLSKMERKELAMAMEAYQTQQGEYVFREKDMASMFFIIKQGQAIIEVNNKVTKPIKSGDFFGELAILYSSPRSASVKTTKKCIFWCLSRTIFLKVQKEMVKNNFKIAKPHVNKLQIFKYLTEKQKNAISYRMHTLKYEPNDIIFNLGDSATSFYIILQGVVQIIIPGMPSLKLQSGDSFGQKCLKEGQIRGGTAKCLQMTDILSIGREDLLNCLGQTSQEQILYHNIIKWSLRRSNLLYNLTTNQQQKFISKGKLVLKQDNQIISNQGENQQYLYICLEGKINDYQIGQIIHQMFAANKDQYLFLSPETLVKKGKGIIFQISLTNVQRQKIKIKKAFASIQSIKSAKQYPIQKDYCFNENSFKDYYIVQKLGQGQMGKVYLVQNKKSQRYALKCIEKNMIIQNQMQKFVTAQKQILQLCDFPLISHLVASYKDNYFVYFLLNYVQGGDFFDLLTELNICDNDTARFYFGCFLLSVEYLHNNMIVYRDLKPQNAVVDSNGYVHMIDMGTAKMLSQSSQYGLRTFTIIGTPHYMAPQIFQAKGYSFSADIWSLGIILYEMVCGVLPYGNCTNDVFAIYKEINNNPLKFPKKYTDVAGRQLILRLLQKNPDKRQVENFLDIKNMDFFKNFSWKLLQIQHMQSPFKPKIPHYKLSSKSQILMNFLQKQKSKMQLPKQSLVIGWDSGF